MGYQIPSEGLFAVEQLLQADPSLADHPAFRLGNFNPTAWTSYRSLLRLLDIDDPQIQQRISSPRHVELYLRKQSSTATILDLEELRLIEQLVSRASMNETAWFRSEDGRGVCDRLDEINYVDRVSPLSYEEIMSHADRLQEQFPKEFQILEITGVSPYGSEPMMNPYLDTVDTEDFSNVGRHCVAVAIAAEAIAEELFNQGQIDDQERIKIISDAILHDADKRFEVMRKKAKNSGKDIDPYSEQGYETMNEYFREMGISTDILDHIRKMGSMTGHNSLKKMWSWDHKRNSIMINPERSLSDMIVHNADDMTHSSSIDNGEKTYYVPMWLRAKLGDFQQRYSFLYQKGFVISGEGTNEIGDISDYQRRDGDFARSFIEWQEYTFDVLMREIRSRLMINGEGNSTDAIIGLVKASIGR